VPNGDGGAMKTPRVTSSAVGTGGQPELHRKHEILQRLQHERNTRLAQVNAMEADKPNANEDLVKAQTTAIRLVLAEIEAAVERVQDGSYGVCHGCKVRIPVGRLEILPYVRYCVRCQQQAL
jgi:RNA polymerase-binding transcription factor DksA